MVGSERDFGGGGLGGFAGLEAACEACARSELWLRKSPDYARFHMSGSMGVC